MPAVIIKPIESHLTWTLRHEVLYPEMDVETMGMPEDTTGLHFGAFLDEELVGVISLFNEGASYQFRKFAVDPTMQGRGIGSIILEYITDYAAKNGGTHLWCNARITAIDFYIKAGFAHTGNFFAQSGYKYEILEKALNT